MTANTPLAHSPLWPMDIALGMAQRALRCGEVPVGAVLVLDQCVVARSHNRMMALGLPFAHAEMIVLIHGMKKLGTRYLSNCHLYVTLEPCALCMQALILARIGRVYFGAYDTSITLQAGFESIGGVQERACAGILNAFFHNQRQK
jgi:tRNA(adenine34) deaminase